MKVTLEIGSDRQFLKLLEFIQLTSTTISVEESDEFSRYLFTAIDNSHIHPSLGKIPAIQNQLQKLEEELLKHVSEDETGETGEQLEQVRQFRKISENGYDADFFDKLYKPTDILKECCGPEWLTYKTGLISRRGVLNFLTHHFKIRDIPVKNGIIHTNEWLRSLLQDGREFIYEDELPMLINHLLVTSSHRE